jgi:hypothetical protein
MPHDLAAVPWRPQARRGALLPPDASEQNAPRRWGWLKMKRPRRVRLLARGGIQCPLTPRPPAARRHLGPSVPRAVPGQGFASHLAARIAPPVRRSCLVSPLGAALLDFCLGANRRCRQTQLAPDVPPRLSSTHRLAQPVAVSATRAPPPGCAKRLLVYGDGWAIWRSCRWWQW